MNVIAFVLMLIAAVVFLLGGPYMGSHPNRPARIPFSSIDLGLALLTIGLIFQFASTDRTFHF